MGATIREVEGLPTTTRVFACYQDGLNLGFLTVDDSEGLVELVYVADYVRGRGVATKLLEYAREETGWPLDRDNGLRTLEGSRWCRARGIKVARGHRYRRIGKADIARQIAALGYALMFEDDSEQVTKLGPRGERLPIV